MRAAGFTLLEVLIAISIFALIGMAGYRLLTTVTQTHERVRVAVDEFSEVGRAMTFMERDFYQASGRPVRDEYGESLPAMIVGGGLYPVEFTRTGWNNPASLPRSSLQRVAYAVNDNGHLVRYFWRVLDRAEDTVPIEQVLIEDVVAFRLTLFDGEGETTDSWPASTGGDPLPAAIEILVDTEATGELRRLIPLVDTPVAVASQGEQQETP